MMQDYRAFFSKHGMYGTRHSPDGACALGGDDADDVVAVAAAVVMEVAVLARC
jgi:hypothetical protein